MMATVPHVTSGLGLRKFQADGFLLTRVYQFPTYPYVNLECQYFARINYKMCWLYVLQV